MPVLGQDNGIGSVLSHISSQGKGYGKGGGSLKTGKPGLDGTLASSC